VRQPQADVLSDCLGAPFVRLEARIALEVLVQRLPDVRLVPAQPMTYLPSLLNRTLQHLQVHWEVAGQRHGHLPAPSAAQSA
jgi:hypothetical protein